MRWSLLNSVMAIGFRKLEIEWRGYHFDDSFSRFDTIHDRDRQIGGQTFDDSIASRGKKTEEQENLFRVQNPWRQSWEEIITSWREHSRTSGSSSRSRSWVRNQNKTVQQQMTINDDDWYSELLHSNLLCPCTSGPQWQRICPLTTIYGSA